MDSLFQDIRYAVRGLLANPGFAVLTIVCLSLGVGVNSTIFSVVDTLSLRPLPFADPTTLVALDGTHVATGVDRGGVSWLDLQDWKARTHAFSTIAATTRRGFTLTVGQTSDRIEGAAVSADLFQMLGATPASGRLFRADEDRPGGADVAVVSHAIWERKLQKDPAVLGRSILLNGRAYTVVGVMPPRFEFPENAGVWIPLGPLVSDQKRDTRSLSVFARLAGKTPIDAARTELSAIATALAREHRENDGWGAAVIPLRDDLIPQDSRFLVMTMMGAVSLVLLISCANVANLLLARATSRQREIALRTALGAGRGRIIRQLLTESVMIGLASAPLGALIAVVGLRWLTSSLPPDDVIPYYIDWSMNVRVLVYIAAVAGATGIVFGLAPALQAADRNLHRALKDGGRGTATSAIRNRTRNALVVFEIALSLVLLVGASLFVRSLLQLQDAEPGINTRSMMTLRYFMTDDRYPTPEDRIRRTKDIVDRVEAVSGVESAFASNFVPLTGGGDYSDVVTDRYTPESGREQGATYFGVTTHAIRTLDLPLLAGRDFAGAEGIERSRVAIVNQVFAKRFFAGRTEVLGDRFRLVTDPAGDWFTIVGIVADFQPWNPRDLEPIPIAFVPYPYSPDADTGLVMRVTGGTPAAITSLVRNEIASADPLIPLANIRSGEENRALNYWQDRLLGWMFSIFGGIALLLSAIGIYGVLSYSVAQRTQEIGVRMALGASRRDVFALVLRQGGRLAAIGILIGVVGAFGVTRIVRTFLYNVTPTDPLSFIGTALFLAAVALAAGYIPARRATAVDPIVALRAE